MTAPWRTAVFEGAGATLWWDLGTGEDGVDVWDAPRAAGWLDAVPREMARQVALDAWREAWWPGSRIADVAPLDPRVLAARRATALAALDGVTDDDAAVERALRELAAHLARLGPLATVGPRPTVRPGQDTASGPAGTSAANAEASTEATASAEIAALAERVRELADDHGVVLAAPAPAEAPQPEDYALAARGGPAGGAPLLEGSDPVDPGAVPQGVVDPLGRIAWQVRLSMTIEVTVPAAPVVGAPPAVPLVAFALPADGTPVTGPADGASAAGPGGHAPAPGTGGLAVPLRRRGDVWRGEAAVGPDVLARRPRLGLRVPGFTPVLGVDAARLVEIAREVGP